MANILYQSFHPGLDEEYLGGEAAFASMQWQVQQGAQEEGPMGGYSTSELNAPEYSTDEFRMFHFKVARCSKRYVHDWRSCPFAHPTENARRRDPRLTRYLPVPCPDYKRGICLRGDGCPYSHGVYECWLHPAKYRTQLCKEGPLCRRPVCFFAHSVGDLRQPTHLWSGNDLGSSVPAPQQQQHQQKPTAAAMLMQQRPPSSGSGSACDSQQGSHPAPSSMGLGARSDSDASRRLIAAEEAMNNMNGGNSSDDGVIGNNGITTTTTGGWVAMQKAPSMSITNIASIGTPLSPVVAAGAPAATEDNAIPATPPRATTEPVVLPSVEVQSLGVEVPTLASAAVVGSPVQPVVMQRAASAELPQTARPEVVPPPRASVDSALQTIASDDDSSAAAADNNNNSDGTWPQGLAASQAMAAAMSGIPVNEQPLLPNHGPRMSNAVARKLGLAPNKTPTPTAQMAQRGHSTGTGTGTAANGGGGGVAVGSPQRISVDTTQGMPSYATVGRNSSDFHTAPRMNASLTGLPGGPASPMAHGAQQFAAAHTGQGFTAGESLNIHPALLNLVAANMNARQHAEAAAMHHHQQQPMSPHGYGGGVVGGGISDQAMASLINSMGQWNVGHQGGLDMHSMMQAQHQQHIAQMMPHRTSSDGMLGMGGMPQVPSQNSYKLPTDLDLFNNQGGAAPTNC